jgi:mannosyl-oligosaccharide glucosidase
VRKQNRISDEVDRWIEDRVAAFDENFERVFQLSSKSSGRDESSLFNKEDILVGKRAVSAVLGGIGYFHGQPRLGNAMDVATAAEEVNQKETPPKSLPRDHAESDEYVLRGEPVSLLSATPSRTSFPRGFLWDEGFHQMVISRWDVSLSMQILADWLNAMYFFRDDEPEAILSSFFKNSKKDKEKDNNREESQHCMGGWIPREMILGTEAEKRVPDEFVTQRVNVANPPTLLLVVESLLERVSGNQDQRVTTDAINGSKNGCEEGDEVCKAAWIGSSQQLEENAAIRSFLRNAYPALQEWTNWYLSSQKGPETAEGSFRWRGRASTDQKLIANTLASGLDDYPRSPVPSVEEFHVDLFSWMARATSILARVSSVLDEAGVALPADVKEKAENANFEEYANYLSSRLDALHWSDTHNAYCDVGFSSNKARVITQVYMRCQREDQMMVDVGVPIEVVRAGKATCPPQFPKFLFIVPDGSGGYKTKERFLAPEELSLQHIPRIGYVSLFPLLMRMLPPGSPRIDAVLDIIESPDLLWSDHGLRSIAKNDTFYRRQNAPGDEPYWR